MNHFKDIVLIGEGTYGKVYKATRKEKKEKIAIKKIEIEPGMGFSPTTIREIRMLKKLRSEHIVKLKDIFFEKESLHLIMEFLPYDLTGLIQNGYNFSCDLVFSLSYQLLSAAKYIHSFGLIHRDIKSSNILIDQTGHLKLADFGLTREVSKLMTNRVCTLWYRAPELLLGAQSYDLKVDSWSIGCVILEIGMKKPPFKANDEVSQIRVILETLGAPTENYMWSEMLEQKRYPVKGNWNDVINNSYGLYFRSSMLQLIGELLKMSPKERISPQNALKLEAMSTYGKKLIKIDSEEVHEHYCKKKKPEDDKSRVCT